MTPVPAPSSAAVSASIVSLRGWQYVLFVPSPAKPAEITAYFGLARSTNADARAQAPYAVFVEWSSDRAPNERSRHARARARLASAAERPAPTCRPVSGTGFAFVARSSASGDPLTPRLAIRALLRAADGDP